MGVWLGLLILSQDTGQMFVLIEHRRDSLIATLLAVGAWGRCDWRRSVFGYNPESLTRTIPNAFTGTQTSALKQFWGFKTRPRGWQVKQRKDSGLDFGAIDVQGPRHGTIGFKKPEADELSGCPSSAITRHMFRFTD